MWRFYNEKIYKKHWIFLKTTSEISLFLMKEVREQTVGFDYYKYDLWYISR